jgi:glycosyltransferase involved in cell wall biosynthesis
MLIDSFAAAIKVVPNLKGLLVGDGPEYKEIGVRVESSGLSGAVRMPGFRNDAQLLIQCMDLFVLSSKSEGTSMALLEAMAAGVPVVVTDVGGNPEIVLHEETGILVRSGSVDALAKAIIEAQRSFEMYRDLGVAGRRRFLERFSFTKMIQSYRNIYDDLLAPAA